MLTHAIDFPDPALVANRTALEVPLRLISVGRLFGRKNVLVMPPVLAECRRRGLDARLTIVGEGPDRMPLETAARDLGVIDRITFRSIPTQAELYQALREHHGLLWTLRRHRHGLRAKAGFAYLYDAAPRRRRHRQR